MSGNTNQIGILILNRNGSRWLAPLYQSIRANGYSRVRTYLVDNASEDESVPMTLQNHPEVKVIRMPKNLGYSMAYNFATPFALADGCEWVIWSNNDVILEPDCLSELVRAFHSDPEVGVAGPAFLSWSGDEPGVYMTGNHPAVVEAVRAQSSTLFDVEWVEGSFLMASRRCVTEIGPLDPLLFLYWEEADFCRRALYRGYRVVLAPRALARHYGGGTSGAGNTVSAATRMKSRNHYIYQLANPRQSFARNMLDAWHLFAVSLKANLNQGVRPLFLEILAFADVLAGQNRIYQKWRNDRAGKQPEIASKDIGHIRVEVITANG